MNKHILAAYKLSGAENVGKLDTEDAILNALRSPDPAWLHMKADDPATSAWIETHLDFLSPVITSALVADETRPRAMRIGDGILLILRGVNTNPGQDPDDMVSIRLWLHSARIVSLSVRQLASVRDIQAMFDAGQGPQNAGAFLCALIDGLSERIETYLADLDDETDELEEQIIAAPETALHPRITEARRQVVSFRRHIGPQRDALDRLAQADKGVFDPAQTMQLREAHERLVRTVEDLDAMRDRLQVVKDELINHQSERLNRNLYILSLVSAVFLPLGFLTGLMGINLGGMPGAGEGNAFWLFSGALLVIAIVLLLVLRRMRMF